MHHEELFGLALILGLGVAAQWLAWRLRLPTIVALLGAGFLVGPTLGWLEPDQLLGELLVPGVSLSVALILYEGGLSLRLRELKQAGNVVWRLVTIGAIVSWALTALFAATVAGVRVELAILLGAILVVTGPTVIQPMLQFIRPSGPSGAVLKWEGIMIDPIGAMLAVLVFEVIAIGAVGEATREIVLVLIKTIGLGGLIGFAAAFALAILLRSYLVPDFLENAVSLLFVLAAYTGAESIQQESGLFAATIMGVTLANQRLADVRHIVEFKENLRVLLISSLFVVLAARLDTSQFTSIGWESIILLVLLILIVRPASVFFSTVGTSLTWRESIFLAWMAPRGIVAAAVTSVFALRLREMEFEGVEALVPITFLVITGTVLIYGLTAPWVARRVGVAEPNPQGLLLVGASAWARGLANQLKAKGIRVLLVDTNRANLSAARMDGLSTYAGSILGENTLDNLDLGGIGKLLVATPNDWVNVLSVQRYARVFGRAHVYQIMPRDEASKRNGRTADARVKHDDHRHLQGRRVFGQGLTHDALARKVAAGAVFKSTGLTQEFTMNNFIERFGENATPLCVVTEGGRLQLFTDEDRPDPKPGDTLISLVDAEAIEKEEPEPETED